MKSQDCIPSVFCVFFSSRRRHTRLTCDWSSDVCSSDLRKKDILLLGCQSNPVWCIQCYRIRLTKERLRVPDAEKSSLPVPNSGLTSRGDGLCRPNLCCSTEYVPGDAGPA